MKTRPRGQIRDFKIRNYQILYVILAAGIFSAISLLVRGPIFDPFTNPVAFEAMTHSSRFMAGLYMNILALILTIFSFFAMWVFLSEHGMTEKGLFACVLSSAGVALILSVLAILIYLAPHISHFFSVYNSKEAGTFESLKGHIPLVMALYCTFTSGGGACLFAGGLSRISVPRFLAILYAAHAFVLYVIPLALLQVSPFWSHAATLLGATMQIIFAILVIRAAKRFRDFRVV